MSRSASKALGLRSQIHMKYSHVCGEELLCVLLRMSPSARTAMRTDSSWSARAIGRLAGAAGGGAGAGANDGRDWEEEEDMDKDKDTGLLGLMRKRIRTSTILRLGRVIMEDLILHPFPHLLRQVNTPTDIRHTHLTTDLS